MQYVEKDTFGDSHYLKNFSEFTYNNRPFLSITFGLATGFLSTMIVFLSPYLTKKNFRDSLMDGIFEQILDNDKNKSRITLFKDAGMLKTLWYRLWDFGGLWRKKLKLKDIIRYCWSARYITILQRWGTEHRNSKTHFYFNPETSESCQGIAGQVRQREVMLVVKLPTISNLSEADFVETNEVVQEYMKIGYISDIKVLKSIKRVSPFIYGNIISVKGGRKKLVFVIDSWARANPFNTDNIELLSTYVKQISATYGD